MDQIVNTMNCQTDIISQLAEDLEVAKLCNDDESLAQVHFVQHKIAETISPGSSEEFHLAADLLIKILKDNGLSIPKQTETNSIINIDLGKIRIEVYRHDYIGNGYFRFEMFGQKSMEYKIGISTSQLAQLITDLPKHISTWLETDYVEAKKEADKLTKQQKISRLSAQALLKSILDKMSVTYSIEHCNGVSHIQVELANDKKLCFQIADNNFTSEIGKITELIRTARDFSVKFANATIEDIAK